MTDTETWPPGWILTIPDETIRFTKMFEILVIELKYPTMIDNSIIPNCVALWGTGDPPSNLEALGFLVHDGIAPIDHKKTAKPMSVWLFVGRANEVQWKLDDAGSAYGTVPEPGV